MTNHNQGRNAIVLCAVLGLLAGASAHASQLPRGVEKVCAIKFDQDVRRPARVEDSALTCLNKASERLKGNSSSKLVLVASADPVRDHAEKDRGTMREREDPTGADTRFEDIAMYRAINSKDYLVRWNKAEPARILPTTDEQANSQQVVLYLVPGDANFVHNYLDTTKTNERVCTVQPCYDVREESLTPQPRSRIQPAGRSVGAKFPLARESSR
jgi:hypothetical protein